MDKRIAVILAAALVLLGACTGAREGKPQNTLNERGVTTGIGNTGAAGTAAAGPSMNSQSATEASREGERR